MVEIDEKLVIIREPEYRVGGVVSKNGKRKKQLIRIGSISLTLGILGIFGFISILSYYVLS